MTGPVTVPPANHGHGGTPIGDAVDQMLHPREQQAAAQLAEGARTFAAIIAPRHLEYDTTPILEEPVTKLNSLAEGLAQLASNKLLAELAEAGIGAQLLAHERQAVISLARTLDDAHKGQVAPPLPQRAPQAPTTQTVTT